MLNYKSYLMLRIYNVRADMEKYFDSRGLLCTENLDGGDTLNRMSLLLIADYVLSYGGDLSFVGKFREPSDTFSWLVAYESAFYRGPIPPRHPDKDKWYSDIFTTTRDQLIPYLSYCVLTKETDRIRAFYNWHKTRALLFAPNVHHGATYQNYEEHLAKLPGDPYRPGRKIPDPTGPEIWSNYSRAFNHPDWVINLWDLHLLESVKYHNKHPSKHVDKLLPRLVVGKYVNPSKNSLKALSLVNKPLMIEQFHELMSFENPRWLSELWEPIINDF